LLNHPQLKEVPQGKQWYAKRIEEKSGITVISMPKAILDDNITINVLSGTYMEIS